MIRSYVRRQGRFTPRQRHALKTLWPTYGLAPNQPITYSTVFNRQAPTFLEIGFGMGQAFVEMAESRPEHNFIGIEVHEPGIGACLCAIETQKLSNVRLYRHNALEVLNTSLPEGELAGIYVLFPDPWPKTRHHKRRFIQPDSVKLLAHTLKPKGLIHLATDCEDYAHHMMNVLSCCDMLCNACPTGQYWPTGQGRCTTKYEQRGRRLGHAVNDLRFYRIKV